MGGIVYGMPCNGSVIKPFANFYMTTKKERKFPFLLKIRPEDTHPLKVFEKTHVEENVYRWVVFVLWLKPHPSAWRWYRSIQKAHPHSVPTIQTLWDHCQEGMAPRKTKRKKIDVSQQWLARYHDPRAPGSLGGCATFCPRS